MDTTPPAQEVDLHRLELRFAEARLLEPQAVASLARSIELGGQLVACIAVAEAGSERLMLRPSISKALRGSISRGL